MRRMNALMNNVLDDKLSNLPTKDDFAELKTKMKDLKVEIQQLNEENELLKIELQVLKDEKRKDHRELMRIVDEKKRNNLIFKGVEGSRNPKEAVEKICKDRIGVPNVEIRHAVVLSDRAGKANILAEIVSDTMVASIFKNINKLRGTNIFVERDLNENRQTNKKMMLQLKRDILAIDKRHKITVRDDKMKIGNNWFNWNKENKLTSQGKDAELLIKNLYGGKLNSISFEYNQLFKKISEKN